MRKPLSKKLAEQNKSAAERLSKGDMLLFLLVGSGAFASAALPVYVHLHPSDFGPPTMEFSGGLQLALDQEQAARQETRQISALVRPKLQLDRLVTGSIAKPESAVGKRLAKPAPDQPFPEDQPAAVSQLEILLVSGGRALVIDRGAIGYVQNGSLLSDGSRVADIAEKDGAWIIETTDGKRITWPIGQ